MVVSQGLRPGVGTAQPLVSWAWALLRAGFPGWGQAGGDPARVVAPSTLSRGVTPSTLSGSQAVWAQCRLHG